MDSKRIGPIGNWEDGETRCIRQKGDRDAGCGSPAKMLGESAVFLAHEKGSTAFGVLTPAKLQFSVELEDEKMILSE